MIAYTGWTIQDGPLATGKARERPSDRRQLRSCRAERSDGRAGCEGCWRIPFRSHLQRLEVRMNIGSSGPTEDDCDDCNGERWERSLSVLAGNAFRPGWERSSPIKILRPVHGRVFPILHLDPFRRAARAIPAIPALRHQTL
jgi:hypothetical protein